MRFVLVGLGNIGAKRLTALGSRCVATVDPVNRAADFATADQLTAANYQAVILSVPNQEKLPLMERFLRLGKHVLVEKPLIFEDRATFERLRSLAEQTGAIWQTGYNHRFEPLVRRAKELLDSGQLGRIYRARLFYGNGTVRHIVDSWRDSGLGVVEDLGSHLCDLAGWLFDWHGDVLPVSLDRHEARCFDHCLLTGGDGRFLLEGSFLSWKNTFTIDVLAECGSLHLSGLCKWEGSELIWRQRVLPSGKPLEHVERVSGPDGTWTAEIDQFELAASYGVGSADNDWWISAMLQSLAAKV